MSEKSSPGRGFVLLCVNLKPRSHTAKWKRVSLGIRLTLGVFY